MTEKMILIQNVGRKIGDKTIARKMVFPKGWDERGQPIMNEAGTKAVEDEILPGKHRKVTESQYKHLKANFGAEIVNLDDVGEMQDKLNSEADKPRARPEGYLSPDEVEAKVRAAVENAMKGRSVEVIPEVDRQNKEAAKSDFDTSVTPQYIDSLDRSELIALIEKQGLDIEYKNYKQPDSLKKAVWTAIESKRKAEDAA